MKKTVTVLFLFIYLLTFFESKAQTSFPFPTENAVWTEVQHIFPSDTITVHYGMIGDTLIKGLIYKKIFTSKDSVFKETNKDLAYFGALRTEGNKTLVLPKPRYAFDTTEYVILDSDLEIDDTLDGGNIHSEAFGLITVHSIDSIRLLDNTLRKRWNFKTSSFLIDGTLIGEVCGFSWIDGIGNTECPFEEPFICAFEVINRLAIFEQNNQIIYTDTPSSQCNLDSTVSTNEQTSLTELNIFPNPSSGIISLQAFNNSYQKIKIKIIDLSGKLVLEDNISFSGFYLLNIEHLTPGMYLIILQDEFSVQKQKLIKL